jgi:hypothetical protein
MPRSGEIGEQIYEQVESLVGQGLSRTEAFSRISEESGRRSGTVAANYYRVARKRGGGQAAGRGGRSRSASPATARSGRRSRRSAGDGNIDELAYAVVQSVQALATAVRDQASEVKDLRDRLDGVRRLLNT